MEYSINNPNKLIPGDPNPAPIPIVTRLDRITQVVKPKTDVLWVVDNSCSMSEEQSALANNFDAFVNYFIGSGLDWHIGVTSTDMRPGDAPGTHGILHSVGGIKFIDENTPDPIEVFRQMADLGTAGSGTEAGIGAAYSAIETHNGCEHNKDFYRRDATLSIITISDENDYSTGHTVNGFISWLTNLKEDVEDISYSSIVCLSENSLNGYPACSPVYFAQPSLGSKYISVTNAIGGILWDVREDDWTPVLEQLGLQAAGLKREFFLTDIPIPETLDVRVEVPGIDGESESTYSFKQDIDYVYSDTRNSITFITYLPPQHSNVIIEYTLLSHYSDQIELNTSDTSAQ